MTTSTLQHPKVLWRGRAFWLFPAKSYLILTLSALLLQMASNYSMTNFYESYLFFQPLFLVLSIIIIGSAIWAYLRMYFERYIVTERELKIYTGVINKRIDSLDLMRLKDIFTYEPFYFKPFGVKNVILRTVDRTHPTVILKGVHNAKEINNIIAEYIRKNLQESLIIE